MKRAIRIILSLLIIMQMLGGCAILKQKKDEQVSPAGGEPVHETVEAIDGDLKKVTFESKALGKSMKFNIFLPTGYNGGERYPVLYMLHGYSGSEGTWMPSLNLDKIAKELIEAGKINPIIIVTPDIENSYGLNTSESYGTLYGNSRQSNMSQGMFEDYIIKDLIPYVDSHYSTDAKKESRYIGGMSMGGHASLYLAFNHTDLFSKAGGHSPALYVNEFPRNLDLWLYPSEEIRKERDPIYIAGVKDLSSLSVYLDCGEQDSYKFYQGCEKLYGILQTNNIASQYFLNQGEHDGEYWVMNSESYLMFYAGK